MRKGWIFAIIIAVVILFMIGVMAGVYFYQKEKVQDSNMLSTKLAEQGQSQIENNVDNEIVSTSATEVKISPNCTIVEKQYFTGCDHLIKNIKEIPEEWINMTEEQIKEQYPDWTLESFTSNQIIVSQEKEGYCGQHYIVRENNGVLAIYTVDENGNETWKEDTEISTMYLTEEDLEIVNKGIEAIGDDQLHTVLEDFE